MDELERRLAEMRAKEELDALRPELDGVEVMELLGIPPGRLVGEALAFLLEVRLEEGVIGKDEAKRRLGSWWRERSP
jgi:poly(A) polymerase